MKFRSQIFLGNGVTLAMLFIISFIVYLSVNSLLDNTKWVEHTYKVIGKANQLTGYMVDQETGMRGFVVSGDDDYLEPYYQGSTAFKELMAEMKVTVSDNPAQVERLQSVESLSTDWKNKVAENYIKLRRDVIAGETDMDLLHEIFAKKEGKLYIDQSQISYVCGRRIKITGRTIRKSAKYSSNSQKRNCFWHFTSTYFGCFIGYLHYSKCYENTGW